jgi:hypothetical protein
MRWIKSAGVISAATFAALALTAATAASATSQASPTSKAAPATTHSTDSSDCKLGGTLLTATPVRTDSLGVRYYAYRSAPGLVTKVAPTGLTAARVTPALLADLGLESASNSKKPLSVDARNGLDREAIALSHAPAPSLCLGNQATGKLLAQPLARPEIKPEAKSAAKAGAVSPDLRWTHIYSDTAASAM